MGDKIVVTYEGQDHDVVVRDREYIQEHILEFLADEGENPDLFSAHGFEMRTDEPLLPYFVESVDGIPACEVPSTIGWVVFSEVIPYLYADTDFVIFMKKIARQWAIILDGLKRMIERGEYPSTLGETKDGVKKMPDIMERLRSLGEDTPAWANDDI